MKTKKHIQLGLNTSEKALLRKKRIRINDLLNYSVEELQEILNIPYERAKVIHALADFQRIPSIGIKFAEDLIFMEFYAVSELKGKQGASLLDAYEKKRGYRTDPCVEDQFRLAVYFADHEHSSKNWWDFTKERKSFRESKGYPEDSPLKSWHENLNNKS